MKTNSKAAYIALIERIRAGDGTAMSTLIEQFQDVAVGLAFGWVGNIDIAREVAQEAFLDTHLNLHQLTDPAAFPAWFHQVVVKHCDRATRRRQIEPHRLHQPLTEEGPEPLTADAQERERLRLAIAALSAEQRQVVALQYFAELTGAETAEFLQIPLSTVKKRLRLARTALMKEAEQLMKDTLTAMRPSNTGDFSTEIRFFIAVHAGDDTTATDLLKARPDLANSVQDWDPQLAWQRVLPFPTRATALITAVELDNLGLARALLDAGADANGLCGCATGEPPLWAAAMMNRVEHVKLLLSHGADPTIVSAAGNTPLHVAAMRGYDQVVRLLLAAGADARALDSESIPAVPLVTRSRDRKKQRTAAAWASLNGHTSLAREMGESHNGPRKTTCAVRLVDGLDARVVETGIKAVDFFTPIPVGGLVRIQFAAGVGMFLLIAELIARFARLPNANVVWTGFEQPPFGSQFEAELAEFGISHAVEPHIADDRLAPDERRETFEAGILRALQLAEAGRDVLAIVLSTEGFENDIDASLPRFKAVSAGGSVTTIVVTPFRREPPPVAPAPPFDVHITFDRRRSLNRLYPAIYPQHSFSNARFNPAHEGLRARAIQWLGAYDERYPELDLQDDASPNTLPEQVLLEYLTQPFEVTEPLGGLPGECVPFDETLREIAARLPAD